MRSWPFVSGPSQVRAIVEPAPAANCVLCLVAEFGAKACWRDGGSCGRACCRVGTRRQNPHAFLRCRPVEVEECDRIAAGSRSESLECRAVEIEEAARRCCRAAIFDKGDDRAASRDNDSARAETDADAACSGERRRNWIAHCAADEELAVCQRPQPGQCC